VERIAGSVSSSFTWRHTFRSLRLPPTVHRNVARRRSWKCEKRYKRNFLTICSFCGIGGNGSKYRGCPILHDLVEKKTRNEPQSEKGNTKPNNQQPSNTERARGSSQSIHPQEPSSQTLHDHPHMSPGNYWSRPLTFTTTRLPQLPSQLYSLNQPCHLPSKYMFVPHANIPQLHYRQDPRLAYKLNRTCRLRSNLSENNGLQPAARKHANCEQGLPTPARNIPASSLPP
jgi:hypothetical protein